MAPTFRFKILTPSKREFEGAVVSIVAPGEDGYLGVLANHAPLITALRAGELKLRFDDTRETRYRIGNGILKVSNNDAILLTESIEPA